MTGSVGLATPLKEVVDARTARGFAEGLELHTVGDLLRHYPRRNRIVGELTPIRELIEGEHATVEAEVVSVSSTRMKTKKGTLQKVVVTDGRDRLTLVFFNQHFQIGKGFAEGRHALFEGKVVGHWVGKGQAARYQVELLHPRILEQSAQLEAGIIPVYPASGKVSSEALARAIGMLLDVLGPVEDPLPEDLRAAHRFAELGEAFRLIHRPESEADSRRAQVRFRYEEAYVLQTILAMRRAVARGLPAVARIPRPGGLLDAFDARLPFTLTDGQLEVGETLLAELAIEHPMQRLLQGEVGSGKTVVALRAMLAVVDAGGQAALLAPTEVLAQQHHRSITELLGPLGLRGQLGGGDLGTRVALLTGSSGVPARRSALTDTVTGDAGIVIGTHALLEERVQFFDLGMVVVDEQHRFGVEQRALLGTRASQRDGRPPHVLVMTATPIPRTVAMTVFGDLETSTLTELPKGRAPIATHVVPASNARFVERTWERVREEVAAGRQAYVVCARIGSSTVQEAEQDPEPDPGPPREDGTRRKPAASVIDVAADLSSGPLKGLSVEILHGQMSPDVKDDVMRRFSAGAIDVLVATTVVEVGVDVANATVMVIMDADRFGVSQLHQIRGRVGRGSEPSVCLLVTEVEEGRARERVDAVAATLDGFALADVDLRLRREGDILGAAQSGRRNSLRFLSVLDHGDVIAEARVAATEVVSLDPSLASHRALREAVEARTSEERADYLERS